MMIIIIIIIIIIVIIIISIGNSTDISSALFSSTVLDSLEGLF